MNEHLRKLTVLSLATATCAALGLSAFAGKEYPELPLKITDETPAQKDARLAWWVHDRFGMFIHFGLYAASARHEWVKSNEYIDDKTYDSKYLPRFNPDLYDAKDWVRQAKLAGMKYMVLTVKHHEGFCMWDTKTTDYKITNTEFKRDLVREYVDACREAGMRVGFYFSIKDWHHPDYLIDATHPLRPKDRKEWTKEKFAELNRGRDWNRYRKYMWDQVDEILKGNALNYSMVFWDQVFREIGAEYPDVKTHSYLVDAASMFMVKDPKRFQVVVASNLFGDILTDLGAAIAGGMGLAAGANLNPERTFPSMFEPIHGSAPDIAGKGLANPLATVWSASQMLEFFGHDEEAKRLLDIIEKLLVEKTCLTPDLGGAATTSEVGDAVVREVFA